MKTSAAARFFCPGDLSQGATRDLPEAAAHHAARVLRLNVGDAVIVFNGAGGEVNAQIQTITKHRVAIRVGAWQDRETESPVAVTLVQGLSARERMDFTIQKAVELGVAEIFPVETRRSVMRLAQERAERRVEHWQNLAISACEQCGRNRVPDVRTPVTLAAWLAAREVRLPGLILAPDGGASLLTVARSAGEFDIVVGPEGGFTGEEIAAAERAGLTALRLGPRVLRTETAGPAMLAAIHALWGDFG